MFGLSEISWNYFFMCLGAALGLYYLLAIGFFYSKDIELWVKERFGRSTPHEVIKNSDPLSGVPLGRSHDYGEDF